MYQSVCVCVVCVCVWLSVCRDTETGLFSLFFLPGSFTKGWPQSTLIVHCDLTWTNWSSKLFLGWCSQSPISICQHTCCTEGHCVFGDTPPLCLPIFPHFQGKSSGTAMRSFAAFLIFFSGAGFIGCKPSSPCPSGQFMLKSQCVLCHPTCSECDGHELFECTTCGVSEYNYLCPYWNRGWLFQREKKAKRFIFCHTTMHSFQTKMGSN